MKMRNKGGKVHPTPPPPPPPPTSSSVNDAVSILKLLPAAILALITVLSMEDRNVLAYMLTRASLQSPNPSFLCQDKAKNGRKFLTGPHHHKPPLFDCDCFECYTWYWFKWDSSPNRELIHLAIEAFEDHALPEEQSRRRNKKKEKVGRRALVDRESGFVQVSPPLMAEKFDMVESRTGSAAEIDKVIVNEVAPPETAVEVMAVSPVSCDKSFARKVLPDVLGLLNSRLWGLLTPTV